MKGYVPDWFTLDNAMEHRRNVVACLNQLTGLRMDRVSGIANYPLHFFNDVQDAITVVERVLGDIDMWHRLLIEEVETGEAQAAAARREASIPAVPYVLPEDGSRGMRVVDVDEIIVGADDVTLGDLRDAMYGLVLRDETSADAVHVSMPTTAWSVISSFLKGAG